MTRIRWDQKAVDHIARHGVTSQQVEEVLAGDPVQFSDATRNGEKRLSYIGPRASGRLLFVVTAIRGGELEIVTAYPADRAKRRWYKQAIKETE